MSTIPRRAGLDFGEVAWLAFTRCMPDVPDVVARRVYRQALARSVHPDAQLLCYRLSQLGRTGFAVTVANKEKLVALVTQVMTPGLLVTLLENAVACRWIERRDANVVTASILRESDREGKWTWVG